MIDQMAARSTSHAGDLTSYLYASARLQGRFVRIE
jgi:hypothetical protein